jgi:hypothetical protein
MRCDREKVWLEAATSERSLIANGTAKVFGVLQRSTAIRAEAKNTKSLAARIGAVVSLSPIQGARSNMAQTVQLSGRRCVVGRNAFIAIVSFPSH